MMSVGVVVLPGHPEIGALASRLKVTVLESSILEVVILLTQRPVGETCTGGLEGCAAVWNGGSPTKAKSASVLKKSVFIGYPPKSEAAMGRNPPRGQGIYS